MSSSEWSRGRLGSIHRRSHEQFGCGPNGRAGLVLVKLITMETASFAVGLWPDKSPKYGGHGQWVFQHITSPSNETATSISAANAANAANAADATYAYGPN